MKLSILSCLVFVYYCKLICKKKTVQSLQLPTCVKAFQLYFVVSKDTSVSLFHHIELKLKFSQTTQGKQISEMRNKIVKNFLKLLTISHIVVENTNWIDSALRCFVESHVQQKYFMSANCMTEIKLYLWISFNLIAIRFVVCMENKLIMKNLNLPEISYIQNRTSKNLLAHFQIYSAV